MEATDCCVTQNGIRDGMQELSGVKWLAVGELDVRARAESQREKGARLITITAYELQAGEGFCLEYIYDQDGQVQGFSFHALVKVVPSIFDICEAADWIEREIHEEYGIDFSGRLYEPLLLREGDRTGVNLREVAQ